MPPKRQSWQLISWSRSGLDSVEQLVEQPLAAQVTGDRQMPAHARVDAYELGKLQDEARREIVDAKIAHVLEDVQ